MIHYVSKHFYQLAQLQTLLRFLGTPLLSYSHAEVSTMSELHTVLSSSGPRTVEDESVRNFKTNIRRIITQMVCFNVTPALELTFGASFGTSLDSSDIERNRKGRISSVIESIDMCTHQRRRAGRFSRIHGISLKQTASVCGCDDC